MDTWVPLLPASSKTIFAKRFGVSLIALAVWLEVAIPAFILAVSNASKIFLTTDDAMRLSEVRDLLAGQSWFDLTQWRMNTPYGVPMHWSRLIDAPIAGLILFFRHFMAPSLAETVTISLWPLLPLLAAWLAISKIAQRIAGPECGIAVAFLAAACLSVFQYFAPGEIDHHGVQVALTLWTVAFLIDMKARPRAAAGAAVVSVISLGIGIETLPYVVAAAAFVGVDWIFRGDAAATATRYFSLTFAGIALILLFGATAAHERFSGACDTFSDFYAALAVTGGAMLCSATFVPLRHAIWKRALVVAIVGALLVGVTLAIAPRCLGGPYANMDPRLYRIFLTGISETHSPFKLVASHLGDFIFTYVYAAFAFVASCAAVFLLEKERRSEMVTVLLFAFIALALASFQYRGLPFATLLGVPGIAITIWLLAVRHARRGLPAALAMISGIALCSDFTFAYAGFGIADKFVSAAKIKSDPTNICFQREHYDQLASLPPGRVMAFKDQGPIILAYTADSVVGGPYHRNAQGIIDSYDFFTKPPRVGETILRKRGIDYVVTCSRGGDRQIYISNGGKTGLLRRLENHDPPSWLKPIRPYSPNAPVRIYRFVHNGSALKPKNNS
jgi:hypothetical protein